MPTKIGCRFHRKLTAREIDVLSLVAGGFSSQEIAQHLKITPSTVESHLESAKSKLGARSRPNLVARAISHGLVDPVTDTDSGVSDHDLVVGPISAPPKYEAEGNERTPVAAFGPRLISP